MSGYFLSSTPTPLLVLRSAHGDPAEGGRGDGRAEGVHHGDEFPIRVDGGHDLGSGHRRETSKTGATLGNIVEATVAPAEEIGGEGGIRAGWVHGKNGQTICTGASGGIEGVAVRAIELHVECVFE